MNPFFRLLAITGAALALGVSPAIAAKKKQEPVAPLASASAGASADASGPEAIAAVVNNEAISSYDVENRLRFIIVTARLSNTPDVIAHIRPQVIRSLIDEKLQAQEAAKDDIKIDDKQVNEAIAAIENQRGMPAGSIDKLLEENHIPRQTFTSQIRTQLAWTKVVGKKLRPDIKISDQEVELARKRFTESPVAHEPGNQEFQIAVLALPVDKPAREGEVRKLAEKLVNEVRAGASFEEVSRQFSSSTSKNGKPDTFWVKPQELDAAVASGLKGAHPGVVTDPIRTEQGYTIVKVYDARAAEGEAPPVEAAADSDVVLKEILLKLKPDADPKEAEILLQIGEDVAKHPGTCEDKGIANIQDLQDFDITVNFRHSRLSELPSGLRIIAANLKVGDSSTPFASNEGIRLFMLCEKKEAAPQLPDPEHVHDLLFREKIELAAQKYLRDMRRDAFVDIR